MHFFVKSYFGLLVFLQRKGVALLWNSVNFSTLRIVTKKQDYSRMKNGGVGWDVNLPVKIFSLLTYSSHLQLQNTSNRGFSRLGVFRNTSNPSFSCLEVFQNASNPRFSRLEATKDSNTCGVETIWCSCGLTVQFFRLLFFKTVSSKKKIGRQGCLFGRKKLKREATTVLVLTFWEGCQNQKIYFWIVWPSSSLDKYFWHPCQKASPRLAFHYSNSSLCVI